MIATFSYSQMTWKNISEPDSVPSNVKPLTNYDNMIVPVRYRYVVASRMTYKDWCGQKKVENQQLYTIQSQDRQINDLLKRNSFLFTADSASRAALKNDTILLTDLNRKYDDAKINLRRNKMAKIGVSVALPVAIALSFLLGWFLHT